jgi:hypothetical protein
VTLLELFPDVDYRFSLKVEKRSAGDYFAGRDAHGTILAERRRWLGEGPESYVVVTDAARAAMEEMRGVLAGWGIAEVDLRKPFDSGGALEECVALGCALEPDFVLLVRGEDGGFRVAAGAVCFPSHWSLPEKVGLPLEAVHGIVPGLNAAIGAGIARLLEKLRPENPLFRSNWGLQCGCERNDHPARRLPRLTAETPLEQVWVRAEHQALVALPTTGAILFGIRIAHHALAEFAGEPALARGLLRGLATMPEAMVRYKGLAAIRGWVMARLASGGNAGQVDE